MSSAAKKLKYGRGREGERGGAWLFGKNRERERERSKNALIV